ncbi:hypothetical protein HanIR_Chr14g0671051 [Helianthus annuus]|nr:hypothetical protein HanIR_Chr14g0671051 [Helianthus annuus]
MFAQFMARDQGYSTYQYDDPYQQSLRAERNLHFEEMLRQQEEMAVESAKIRKILNALEAKVEPEITMDVSAPPPVQQEDREENTGQFIIDFSCSNEEIDAQLAAYKRWKGEDLEEVEEEVEKEKVQPEKPTTGYTYDVEGNYLGYMLSTGELIPTFPELGKELPYEEWSDEEITSVTETKMDEVPPPVPQVSIINYWSDSDDEIDEEKWVAYQRSLVKKKVIEEEVELGDSTGWMFDEVEKEKVIEEEVELGDSIGLMFGAEEEIEEIEIKSSGEDEFLELELDGLPVYEEVEVLDPDGDIAYFDALLEGELTVVIEPAPDEETKCGDHPARVVEEEEHHNWPMVLVIGEPEKSEKPREKAKKRKRKDLNRKRIEGWGEMEKKKPLQFTHDQSSRYMSCIRFLPGKYKFWWSDSFENFKIFFNSTIKFLTIFEDRMELNGLDRVQIKEKPPD